MELSGHQIWPKLWAWQFWRYYLRIDIWDFQLFLKRLNFIFSYFNIVSFVSDLYQPKEVSFSRKSVTERGKKHHSHILNVMTSLTSAPWSLKKHIQNESSKLISVGTHNDYDADNDHDIDSVTNYIFLDFRIELTLQLCKYYLTHLGSTKLDAKNDKYTKLATLHVHANGQLQGPHHPPPPLTIDFLRSLQIVLAWTMFG